MSKSMIDSLHHVLVECEYLEKLKQNGLTKAELLEDETKKIAIVRRIEIIGETTKNIDKFFLEKFPQLNWKQIAVIL